ncbi:MAG: hypothetical protein JSR79_12990 [Proteobacteria bacterium]|nr:hypothetical protein [Pseudomonadota bacterium]
MTTFDTKNGLFIIPMAEGGKAVRAPLTLGVNTIRSGGDYWPAVWRSDSRAVWAADQRIMAPRGGWALGPKRPVVVSLGGRVQRMPALLSPAGGLDGIYWIGNDGLALAALGAGGSYYKPELPNPTPTLALIDARRGRIIQTAPMTATMGLPFKLVSRVAGGVDGQRRPRVLMWFGPDRWYYWAPGIAPRHVLPGNKSQPFFALAADGAHVLISTGLSARGMICEIWSRSTCPPPTPVTGVAAELRDLQTGKLVWEIRATARYFSSINQPVVSRDGRFALITLPGEGDVRETTALISMADGRIVQRVNQASSGSAGFSMDGRSLWIADRMSVAIYDLR